MKTLYDHILIRYGELSLKKSNRKQFINKVNQHIKISLAGFGNLKFQSNGLRYYIVLNETNPFPIIELLKKIPGIYSFSLVAKCLSEMTEICTTAQAILEQEDYQQKTFKVETHRGEKRFPHTSLEISKMVGSHLFRNMKGIKADVHNPEIVVNIDVRYEGTFIYTKVYYGLGGLPSGTLGKGLLMISGGIDSVVAGYLSIKKGLEIKAIHFESYPYTSLNALQKVIDLLETLTPYVYGGQIKLYVVPFTEIQESIYKYTQNDYCITIMRRMMYRIAEQIAKKENCLTILNGESIGQVASQTLESISVIEDVVKIPVIRPLAIFDKQDIVDIAVKINSYDISIRPYEDCCTVFVPKHPQIKPSLSKTIEEENKFAYSEMLEKALNNVQIISLDMHKHHNVIEEPDIL